MAKEEEVMLQRKAKASLILGCLLAVVLALVFFGGAKDDPGHPSSTVASSTVPGSIAPQPTTSAPEPGEPIVPPQTTTPPKPEAAPEAPEPETLEGSPVHPEPSPGPGPEPKAKLDLERVKVTLDEKGKLNGAFDYSLIVGTFYEWNTDPTAIPGLFDEFTKRTGVKAKVDFGSFGLDEERLLKNPFILMTGNRFFSLTDEETSNVRRYLEGGGVLYADDCGGADWSFRHMVKKLLGEKAELKELGPEHDVFGSFYKIKSVPKIIDLYHGKATLFGAELNGRLAILYTYDTDVQCGWEKNPDGTFVHLLTPEKHENSLKFGVNLLTYVLTELAKREGE